MAMPREPLIRAVADADIEDAMGLWTECDLTERMMRMRISTGPTLPEPPKF
jgi:hypothetical protein